MSTLTPEQKVKLRNIHIEKAKNCYEGIAQIVPPPDFGSKDTFTQDEQKALSNLLANYLWHMEQIEQISQDELLEKDLPIQEMSSSLSEYYNKKLLRYHFDLRVLYSAVEPREFTLYIGDELETIQLNRPPDPQRENSPDEILIGEQVAELISAAVDYFDWSIVQNPPDDDVAFDEQDVRAANKLIKSTLFKPNQWLSNITLLQPVLTENDSVIPLHVKLRLREVYRSFIFGNWMAVFALSRSILEYGIIDRAARLGIVVRAENGKAYGISELVRLATEVIQDEDVQKSMELLKEKGNWVMHPKKKDKLIQLPLVLRHHALDCIKSLRVVVNELYVHRR